MRKNLKIVLAFELFLQCITLLRYCFNFKSHPTAYIDTDIYMCESKAKNTRVLNLFFLSFGILSEKSMTIKNEKPYFQNKTTSNQRSILTHQRFPLYTVVMKSGSNGTLESTNSNQGSRMRLRRSDMSSIERARSRTLKMTIIIVVAFFFCWTPYITMNLW